VTTATESGGVLAHILSAKREEIARMKAALPSPFGAGGARRPRDVCAALARPPGTPLRLIAEHKRRSPSAGQLSTALSPVERARAYASAGATMLSVLTDARFFDGAWDHLARIREALPSLPLLAKEFVLDEVQIDAAAAAGADAVLLIARIVDAEALARLAAAARDRGLEPLVEVVTEEELAAARGACARVIGVNARDLDTLVIDRARAERVLAQIDDSAIAVHLSGLKTADDVRQVAATRADAALVGETLMREDRPEALLRAMVEAARSSLLASDIPRT
jgi:indole-3-glycerol phosphate synthase